MANTILQIRRGTTTAVPASLANGELAYSSNGTSNSLFIGSPDGVTGVIRIAGGKYPYLHQGTAGGILTANAVPITDANAYMSNTYTSGLFVSPSIASPAANSTAALITSITPVGNTTQIGSTITGTNTELATTYAITTYVNAKVGGGSVNTQAQYSFSNTITFSNAVSFPVNSRILDSTGSQGTIGQVLTSNGTGNVYWSSVAGVNTSAQYTFANTITFSSNVTINASASITGNLNVTGTITSIDAINLQIKDNFIRLADGNLGVSSDIVDFGIYAGANSAGTNTYFGIGRVASTNTFTFFSTTNDPSTNNNIIGTVTGMAVSAGSLTLTTTALSATSGGTAQNTYAAGDTLYASAVNTLSKLTVGANGNVLQVINNLPAWGGIDCGTF